VSDQYQLLAADRLLEMDVTIEPDIFLTADSDLLRQALHGLLENAVRYAKSKVSVACASRENGPLLEIRNDRDPVTIATSGLGMGLRLVRGICKACAWNYESGATEHDFHATIRFGTMNSFPSDADRE
jgi:K+-sensing histidine kinase KdpD